jgi:hypothetical protein
MNVKEISLVMNTNEANILNWLKRGRKELEKEMHRNPEFRNFNIKVPILLLILLRIGANHV